MSKNKTDIISAIEAHDVGWPDFEALVALMECILRRFATSPSSLKSVILVSNDFSSLYEKFTKELSQRLDKRVLGNKSLVRNVRFTRIFITNFSDGIDQQLAEK